MTVFSSLRNSGTFWILMLLFVVCTMASGEGLESDVSILVSDFNDPDHLSIPAARIVKGWLEQEFRSTDYITANLLDQLVPYGESGFVDAVAAAHASNGDIVFLGSCIDDGDQISVAITSIVATDCPGTYSRIDMFFDGQASLTPVELTLGSETPERFKFYAYLILADWMLNMNRLEEADEFLGQSLLHTENSDPEHLYIAFATYGELKQILGLDYDAIQILSSALATFPDDVFLLRRRASSFDAVGDLDAAISVLFKAHELEPDNSSLNAQLGAQLKQAERYTESMHYLGRSLEHDSSNAMVFRDCSRVHYGVGDFEPALEAIDCAIEMEPENPQGHSMRGFILYEMNNPAEAMESFDAAIERETDPVVLPWIVIGRGICRVALGDYQLALEDLNTTIEYSSSFYLAYYYMGIANLELGNTDSAEEYLTEFLSHPLVLSPVDPWTKEGLHESAEELLRNM